ncbi:zinc-dependent alcohol dehydrogenase family protein [Chryseolinea sp. H1M3-3]|uniref:zinc-dependent alcohol dehydrogenase family protein n=1 Tax=Chryseolinea sp. H1M3-3 TaxID=3034144 RepID=UPI0023EDD07B|nr:zinc-dependent alcohol dehydrogenase family protein [Chryseolinea sp. H1M3-3]
MKALVLRRVCDLLTEFAPLKMVDLPTPQPGSNEILIKVSCCGVCHTELDEIEGRTPPSHYPMVLGHQVVGNVYSRGTDASRFSDGTRVGIAWIFSACGSCEFCKNKLENLCPDFKGTGRDASGGYAEYIIVHEKFAYAIPEIFSDAEAAPLLCAGAIGYRSLKLSQLQNHQTLGLSGFGASGHLVLKMTRYLFPDSKIIVFARRKQEQDFAMALGANWAGDISDVPPYRANAIIDTTPVWKNIVESMRHLKPAGRLIINAIRKEKNDKSVLLNLSYQDHLWMEKEIKSVANISRQDVEEFLALAAQIPIKPEIQTYPFDQANEALYDLKHKHVKGAKVLVMK